MLIDEPQAEVQDFVLSLIASVNGNNPETKRIQEGVYLIGHFGSSNFLEGYEEYPEIKGGVGPYGVCDSPEQLLEKCPFLLKSSRKFVVTLTPVEKATQSESGGWRWHKWGTYIGDQKPQCEYLYDEPVIEKVYVFHIYEKLGE